MIAPHRINQGQIPELAAPEGSDLFFVPVDETEDAARKLLTVLRQRVPARFGWTLCPGDKVMLVADDYEVARVAA